MIQDIYDPEFFIKIYYEQMDNGEPVWSLCLSFLFDLLFLN